MADGELTVADEILDGQGQLEQAEGIGDCGAAFADFGGDFFLFKLKLLDELSVALRFLHRIEVLALEVLNEREFQDSSVVGFANDDRDFGQAEQLGCSPAAFASNELEVSVLFANN